MPLYEFQCNDCTAVFEVLIITEKDKDSIRCKKCNGTSIKKIPSLSSVRTGGTKPLGPSISPGPGSCGSGGFS